MQHKGTFIAAAVPTWTPGLLCALGHITGFLSFQLCLCASLGDNSKSNFQNEVSVNGRCGAFVQSALVFLSLWCLYMYTPPALVAPWLSARFPGAYCVPQPLVDIVLPARVSILSASLVRMLFYNFIIFPLQWSGPLPGAGLS